MSWRAGAVVRRRTREMCKSLPLRRRAGPRTQHLVSAPQGSRENHVVHVPAAAFVLRAAAGRAAGRSGACLPQASKCLAAHAIIPRYLELLLVQAPLLAPGPLVPGDVGRRHGCTRSSSKQASEQAGSEHAPVVGQLVTGRPPRQMRHPRPRHPSSSASPDRRARVGMGRPWRCARRRNSYATQVPTLCAMTCAAGGAGEGGRAV